MLFLSQLIYFWLVAHGAAIQGAVLSGEKCIKDYILLDVCPLTLGISVKGGVMSKIVNRNTVIPTKETQPFTTTVDNQEVVSVEVYEGERKEVKYNHFLGKFELTGIIPAPRSTPQIDVTFDIDVNGILTVRQSHFK